MKKFLTIALLSLISFTINAQPPKIPQGIIDSAQKHLKAGSTTVYNDTKSFYQTDVKSVISYGVDKTEQAVDTLYKLLGKGYNQLSKGASHTFQVLKTQQLVKSIHHLILWILGSILLYTFFNNVKKEVKEPTNSAGNIITIVIIGTIAICLMIYNSIHFMEMWTGFINPEYGVYMEILEYLNK